MMPLHSDQKRVDTLRARLALCGVILHELEGDYGRLIYIAVMGAWTRQLDTVDEVEAFVSRVTGGRHVTD